MKSLRRLLISIEGKWISKGKTKKARLRRKTNDENLPSKGKRKGSHKEGMYPKLATRYYGPFRVIERINEVAFRLALPSHWRIQNAFYVSLLRKYVGRELTEPINGGSPEVGAQRDFAT